MTKVVSSSPERYSFQKEGYIKRQTEEGNPPNENYLDYFEKVIDNHQHNFDDPETHKNNLEYDLLTTDWILEKTRTSESYAQNLYAAMCNRDFQKLDVVPILKDQLWSCSWRYAGGIIADMRQEGDYINWYCSGIRDTYDNNYVGESVVTDEIREDLRKLGWIVLDDDPTEI